MERHEVSEMREKRRGGSRRGEEGKGAEIPVLLRVRNISLRCIGMHGKW